MGFEIKGDLLQVLKRLIFKTVLKKKVINLRYRNFYIPKPYNSFHIDTIQSISSLNKTEHII